MAEIVGFGLGGFGGRLKGQAAGKVVQFAAHRPIPLRIAGINVPHLFDIGKAAAVAALSVRVRPQLLRQKSGVIPAGGPLVARSAGTQGKVR